MEDLNNTIARVYEKVLNKKLSQTITLEENGVVEIPNITASPERIYKDRAQRLIAKIDSLVENLNYIDSISVLNQESKNLKEIIDTAKDELNTFWKNFNEGENTVKSTTEIGIRNAYGQLRAIATALDSSIILTNEEYGQVLEIALSLLRIDMNKAIEIETDTLVDEVLSHWKGEQQIQRTSDIIDLNFNIDENGNIKDKDNNILIQIKDKTFNIGNATIEHQTHFNANSATSSKTDVYYELSDQRISAKNWNNVGEDGRSFFQRGLGETSIFAAIQRSTNIINDYIWMMQNTSKAPSTIIGHEVAKLSLLVDIAMGNFADSTNNANILIINQRTQKRIHVFDMAYEIHKYFYKAGQNIKLKGYEDSEIQSLAKQVRDTALRISRAGPVLVSRHLFYYSTMLSYLDKQKVTLYFNPNWS